MKTIFWLVVMMLVGAGAAHAAPFTVTSTTVQDGKHMPKTMEFSGFGCTGGNISPQLSWSNPPAATKSFAITVYDPDAPTSVGWWHWLVYNIPSQTRDIAAGSIPPGSLEGYTDFGSVGFGGACPPIGDKPHRYIITVYALSVDRFDVPSAAMTGAKLRYLMRDVTVGQAVITGLYGRP
ncbi:MAG: YbhB/YbcL family Raf kinase inhibitor-like protein [Holosporales bacterium]